MTRAALALVLTAALAGCVTRGADLPLPPLDPCPVAMTAPVEAAPVAPVTTQDQRVAAKRGILAGVGPELGAAIIQHQEVDTPAWGQRGWSRVAVGVAWCAARRPS